MSTEPSTPASVDPGAVSGGAEAAARFDEATRLSVGFAEAQAARGHLDSEIDRLAKFIMAEVPGEPSQSQGAVDTAIRVMRALLAEVERLRVEVAAHEGELGDMRAQLTAAETDRDEIAEQRADAREQRDDYAARLKRTDVAWSKVANERDAYRAVVDAAWPLVADLDERGHELPVPAGEVFAAMLRRLALAVDALPPAVPHIEPYAYGPALDGLGQIISVTETDHGGADLAKVVRQTEEGDGG